MPRLPIRPLIGHLLLLVVSALLLVLAIKLSPTLGPTLVEISLAGAWRITLGGHIALLFDLAIGKDGDPYRPLCRAILVGLGCLAGACLR